MPASEVAQLAADAAASESEEGLLREPRLARRAAVRVRGTCAVIGAVVGVALAVTAASRAVRWRSTPSVAPANAIQEVLVVPTVKEYKKRKSPPPKPDQCSLAFVQNCAASQCCEDFDFQCYAKNASYGACMESCEPARLKKTGNGTWSCKPLGLKNRCARLWEDCAGFGCCADDNYQCYEQQNGKASCKQKCDPGAWPTKGWTCAAIGPRNTYHYAAGVYAPGMMETAPPLRQCSVVGESCAATKCCDWSGYQCYEKNASWASCLMNCHPGKANGGISNQPIVQPGSPENHPPAHWFTSFQEVGPGPWTCKHLTPPLKWGWQRGTSLYCFTVAVSNNGAKKPPPELELVKAAQEVMTSVFACDFWNVFSDAAVELKQAPNGWAVKVEYTKVVHSGTAVRRPNTKIYVNTLLYVNVWKYIKKQSTWASFSWVVKADPITVFIPSRLRTILSHQLSTPKGVYLENCKYTRMSLHGSLEVVSKVAFGTFLANLDECLVSLPWKDAEYAHFRYYGEDKFLLKCMDKHGVDRVPSRQMVDTVPTDQNLYGLHLTVSCPGHRSKKERKVGKWTPNCTRSATAAMHPFKTKKAYMQCLQNTTKLWPGFY